MAHYILPFEKMQGLGNDFVVLHYRHLPEQVDLSELAKTLCQRHWSIGADGLIVARPSSAEGDFAWDYLNADGSIGEMCGNGMRCLAKYLFDRGIATQQRFTVETLAGLITCVLQDNGEVQVDMGIPRLEPAQIPLMLSQAEPALDHPVIAEGKEFFFTAVSMGNPHAVIWLNSAEELETLPLAEYGPCIATQDLFPRGTNVEFAYLRSATEIILRVWERGAGATLACGTGACAVVVAAILHGWAQKDTAIRVQLPGGTLSIEWCSADNRVYLQGPAQSVFIGQVELEIAE